MSGQSANMSREEVRAKLNAIQKNKSGSSKSPAGKSKLGEKK